MKREEIEEAKKAAALILEKGSEKNWTLGGRLTVLAKVFLEMLREVEDKPSGNIECSPLMTRAGGREVWSPVRQEWLKRETEGRWGIKLYWCHKLQSYVTVPED